MTAESNALKRVCEDLGVPAPDSYTQDWAYELPEAYRTEDYFNRYLGAYKGPGYGAAEKHLVMQLMLDIANDSMANNMDAGKAMWAALRSLLQQDHVLHTDLIEHWALVDEPIEDAFALTPFVRELREELRTAGR